jgi:type II secretory pathway pseudopilin PulG
LVISVLVGNGQNMINQHTKRLRAAEQGFDLVQALVVVVILGALATIAALTLLGETSKGDAAAVRANIGIAVDEAARIQNEDGSTNAWAAGIGNSITTAVPSVTAPQPDGTNPLVISQTRKGNGCQASIALATGAVTYAAPAGTTKACPDNG